MNMINRRAALRGIATLSATAGATAALALPAISQPADASPVLATPAGRPAAIPLSASPKLLELEVAFKAEWEKHKATLPAHSAAERAWFDSRPPAPKKEKMPPQIDALWGDMRMSELRDKTSPWNVESAKLYQVNQERSAAWEAECKAVEKRIGWARVERQYQRQLDRTSRAADRLLYFPARSLADLAVKTRVNANWPFYSEEETLRVITADIARVVRSEGKAVRA